MRNQIARKRSNTTGDRSTDVRDHSEENVGAVLRTRLFLPTQVHQHIAYFLTPHKVSKAEDLAVLVESYPVEYLCVEFQLAAEEQSGVVSILSREPRVLREVILTQLDYEEYAFLVGALLKLKSLEGLSLQLRNVVSSSVDEFVRHCCNSRNKCHFFDLDLGTLTADMASILVEKLVRGDMSLTYLDVRRIEGWKDKHNRYLSLLTSRTVSLAHLRCCGVEFDLAGAKLLADALARNCRLKSVWIGDGPIGDAGVVLIAEALAKNALLERFRGYHLGMSPAGASKLAAALLTNRTLLDFTLRDEDVGESGAYTFAKVLEKNRSLRSLGLRYCSLGGEGCHSIVNAVETNNVLESLDIAYNGISSTDAERLMTMPSKWYRLYIDEGRLLKSPKPRNPYAKQYREEFEINFRQHNDCVYQVQ